MSGQGPNDLFLTTWTADPSPENPSFLWNSRDQGCGQKGGGGRRSVLGSQSHHTDLDFGSLGAISRSPGHLQALMRWPGHLLLRARFLWQGAHGSGRWHSSGDLYEPHLPSVYNTLAIVHPFSLRFAAAGVSILIIASDGTTEPRKVTCSRLCG